MSSFRPFRVLTACLTIITFLATNVIWAPGVFATAPVAEVLLSYQSRIDSASRFSIPRELGTLEYFRSGKGPAVVHLQTAHGHYQAQKQIQALLHHLDKQYGIQTVLVEGSAFELQPELLNFFPKDRELTLKANEALTRAALVKGPELYLLDKLVERGTGNGERSVSRSAFSVSRAADAAAYGIEKLDAYRENSKAFADVLAQKEKTAQFLTLMNEGIERLTAVYLQEGLRNYLKRLESFEKNRMPFEAWLAYLKGEALKQLKLDLTQPGAQIDWPMLVRVLKIQELAAKLDKKAFSKERDAFLSAISRWLPDQRLQTKDYSLRSSVFSQIESILHIDSMGMPLPDPETSFLFEAMVKALPRDFNYEAFPNVRYFIGALLLQSEIKAQELMAENQRLSGKIAEKLARSRTEKTLLGILKDYRLLQKLFALELSPEDYEVIRGERLTGNGERESLRPSEISKRFNKIVSRSAFSVSRVKNVEFSHLAELDQLFDAAMKFYAGAKERDGAMLRRIEERLKETGADKVAVITGGFHAAPFKGYFSSQNYTYALISPRLTAADDPGHEAYVRNMLRTVKGAADDGRRMANNEKPAPSATFHPESAAQNAATIESVFASDLQVSNGANPYGIDQAAMRAAVRRIVSEVAARQGYSGLTNTVEAEAETSRSEIRTSFPVLTRSMNHRFMWGMAGLVLAGIIAAPFQPSWSGSKNDLPLMSQQAVAELPRTPTTSRFSGLSQSGRGVLVQYNYFAPHNGRTPHQVLYGGLNGRPGKFAGVSYQFGVQFPSWIQFRFKNDSRTPQFRVEFRGANDRLLKAFTVPASRRGVWRRVTLDLRSLRGKKIQKVNVVVISEWNSRMAGRFSIDGLQDPLFAATVRPDIGTLPTELEAVSIGSFSESGKGVTLARELETHAGRTPLKLTVTPEAGVFSALSVLYGATAEAGVNLLEKGPILVDVMNAGAADNRANQVAFAEFEDVTGNKDLLLVSGLLPGEWKEVTLNPVKLSGVDITRIKRINFPFVDYKFNSGMNATYLMDGLTGSLPPVIPPATVRGSRSEAREEGRAAPGILETEMPDLVSRIIMTVPDIFWGSFLLSLVAPLVLSGFLGFKLVGGIAGAIAGIFSLGIISGTASAFFVTRLEKLWENRILHSNDPRVLPLLESWFSQADPIIEVDGNNRLFPREPAWAFNPAYELLQQRIKALRARSDFRSEVRETAPMLLPVDDVVHLAYEAADFFGKGGVKDVVREKPQALLRYMGAAQTVIMPAHPPVFENRTYHVEDAGFTVEIPLEGNSETFKVYTADADGVRYYFLENGKYFQNGYRESGSPEALLEYSVFSRAAVELLRKNFPEKKPDIIHLHDAHAGLAAAFVRAAFPEEFKTSGIVFTIHNANPEYQQRFYPDLFNRAKTLLTSMGMPEWAFGWKYLEFHGGINLMKAGLIFSEKFMTVSPQYRKELLADPYTGLREIFQERQNDFEGISNGLDAGRWSPATDRAIYVPYEAAGVTEGKLKNKLQFQKEIGLYQDSHAPLFVSATRLAETKGPELILEEAQRILRRYPYSQFVLTTDKSDYEQGFRELKETFPGRVFFTEEFSNEAFVRKALAAADFFLMPSKSEPFGVGAVQALRYGAIPIVHSVGGLQDTVVDPKDDPAQATGFKFFYPGLKDIRDLADKPEFWKVMDLFDAAVWRAMQLRKNQQAFKAMRERGMKSVRDWEGFVPDFQALYVAARVNAFRLNNIPLPVTARSEMRATLGEIDRGVKIFEGKVAADPVKAVVRPSTEEDLQENYLPNFKPEERDRLSAIAVRKLSLGVHAFSSAAAGASSRMPISEAPETLRAFSDRIHGKGHFLQSKAAVPVGEYGGRAYSFLGLMLADIARLEREISDAIPGAEANKVLIMTNPEYQDELDNELRHNYAYGVPPKAFIRNAGRLGFQQDLGPKYYLGEADVERVYNLILDKNSKGPEERAALSEKLRPVYEASLQKAREVREAIRDGEIEKVVHPTERDPAGHLEFFNQMVSKGVLLDMIDEGIETLSFRNIDNAAATFTEDFLVLYGYMIDRGLDALIEVSRRGAGMKGGGWLIDKQGNHQIAEDPTIDATWQLILKQNAGKRWTRKVIKNDKAETIPDSVLHALQAGLERGEVLSIEPTRLSFISEQIRSVEELEKLVPSGKDAKIAAFEDAEGKLHLIRKVTSADTSAINDAVAIFSIGYLLDCYRLPGQSRQELIEEMRAAKTGRTLEEIAERGRVNAPLLIDPKPARDKSVIGLTKAEGNMWQTTGTVPSTTKVEAIVVRNTQDIDPGFDRLTDPDRQVEAIRDFRFMATKQWKGPVESYEANLRFIKTLFQRIFERPRFDPKILEHRDFAFRSEENVLRVTSTEDALRLLRGGLKSRGAEVLVSTGFEIRNGGELLISPKDFQPGVSLFIGNNVVIDGIQLHLRLGGNNKVIIDGGTEFKAESLKGLTLQLKLREGEWLHINPPVLAEVIEGLRNGNQEALIANYKAHLSKNEFNKAFFIRKIVESLLSSPLEDAAVNDNAFWVKEQIDAIETARHAKQGPVRSEARGGSPKRLDDPWEGASLLETFFDVRGELLAMLDEHENGGEDLTDINNHLLALENSLKTDSDVDLRKAVDNARDFLALHASRSEDSQLASRSETRMPGQRMKKIILVTAAAAVTGLAGCTLRSSRVYRLPVYIPPPYQQPVRPKIQGPQIHPPNPPKPPKAPDPFRSSVSARPETAFVSNRSEMRDGAGAVTVAQTEKLFEIVPAGEAQLDEVLAVHNEVWAANKHVKFERDVMLNLIRRGRVYLLLDGQGARTIRGVQLIYPMKTRGDMKVIGGVPLWKNMIEGRESEGPHDTVFFWAIGVPKSKAVPEVNLGQAFAKLAVQYFSAKYPYVRTFSPIMATDFNKFKDELAAQGLSPEMIEKHGIYLYLASTPEGGPWAYLKFIRQYRFVSPEPFFRGAQQKFRDLVENFHVGRNGAVIVAVLPQKDGFTRPDGPFTVSYGYGPSGYDHAGFRDLVELPLPAGMRSETRSGMLTPQDELLPLDRFFASLFFPKERAFVRRDEDFFLKRGSAAVDYLAKKLKAREEGDKIFAAGLLAAIKDRSAIPALTRVPLTETPAVRVAVESAIEEIRGAFSAERGLQERREKETDGITELLEVPKLIESLGDENADVREKALNTLRRIQDPVVVFGLVRFLEARKPETLERVIGLLEEKQDAAAVPALMRVVTGEDVPPVRQAAVRALGAIGDPSASPALAIALSDRDENIREEAAKAFAKIKYPAEILPKLVGHLGDIMGVRIAIAKVLSAREDPRLRSLQKYFDWVGNRKGFYNVLAPDMIRTILTALKKNRAVEVDYEETDAVIRKEGVVTIREKEAGLIVKRVSLSAASSRSEMRGFQEPLRVIWLKNLLMLFPVAVFSAGAIVSAHLFIAFKGFGGQWGQKVLLEMTYSPDKRMRRHASRVLLKNWPKLMLFLQDPDDRIFDAAASSILLGILLESGYNKISISQVLRSTESRDLRKLSRLASSFPRIWPNVPGSDVGEWRSLLTWMLGNERAQVKRLEETKAATNEIEAAKARIALWEGGLKQLPDLFAGRPGRRSEIRLTDTQRGALDLAQAAFGLIRENVAYVTAALLAASGSSKNPNIHGDTYEYSLKADRKEREKFGYIASEKFEGHSRFMELAKSARVRILPLDGGLGEKLRRALWKTWLKASGFLSESEARLDEKGNVILGSKGSDTGVVFVNEKDSRVYFISAAEAKLWQIYKMMESGRFKEVAFRALVNKDSKPSYEALFEKKCLVDRLNGVAEAQQRTYGELFKEIGVDVEPFYLQQDLPGVLAVDKDPSMGEEFLPATTSQGVAQPGGHGQIGFGLLALPEEYVPAADGAPEFEVFNNGDNWNGTDVDPSIIGHMIATNGFIAKLAVPASRIDRKGGKEIFRNLIYFDQKVAIPTQLELAGAQAEAKQTNDPAVLDRFLKAGQPEGELIFGKGTIGKQYFNTNTFVFRRDRLMPLLADLKELLGEEKYYTTVIRPHFLEKAPKKAKDDLWYRPIDSAIGNLIHNLNAYVLLMRAKAENPEILTEEDNQVLAIFEKHKVGSKILSIYEVTRTPHFVPQKNPFDTVLLLLGRGGLLKFDPVTGTFKESQRTYNPPKIDIQDSKGNSFEGGEGRYSELLTLLRTFVGRGDPTSLEGLTAEDILNSKFDLSGLDALEIDGDVILQESVLRGRVIINSEISGYDLHQIPELLDPEGQLVLEDVEVYIPAKGRPQIYPLEPGATVIRTSNKALKVLGELAEQGAKVTFSKDFKIKNGGGLVIVPGDFGPGVDLFIGNNVTIDGVKTHLHLGGNNQVIIDDNVVFDGHLAGLEIDLTLQKGDWIHVEARILKDTIDRLKEGDVSGIVRNYKTHVAKGEKNKAFFIRRIINSVVASKLKNEKVHQSAHSAKERIDAFASGLDPKQQDAEREGPARSEMRTAEEILTELERPEVIKLIEQYYFNIFPMRFQRAILRTQGRGALLQALHRSVGLPAGNAAGEVPETAALDALIAPEEVLEVPPAAASALSQSPVQTAAKLGGSVFLGQDVLRKLMTENPRALFYLLKEYAAFAEQDKAPALVTVGPADLIAQIRLTLINKHSGLKGLEIAELAGLFRSLEQGKILKVVAPEQGKNEAQIINEMARTTQGGVASLHLNKGLLPELAGGVHFAFGENIGSRDLMVASVLAIVLKSAADLIRNIPDAEVRVELLNKFVSENLPGVQKQGNNSFVIGQIAKLAQEFVTQAYIARMA